jgi:hypothetical protein
MKRKERQFSFVSNRRARQEISVKFCNAVKHNQWKLLRIRPRQWVTA